MGGPGPSPYAPTQGVGQPRPGANYPYQGPPSQAYAPAGRPRLPPASKKTGKGLVIGLVAVAVAFVLMIGGVAAFLLANRAASASTEPDKATKSTTALQGFLEALAAGDADKAKQYAMNPPADAPLLTNDFLKATVAKSPVTEIQVDAHSDSGSTGYLTANYKLGGTVVQGNYQLTKVAKVWKLNSVVTTVNRPASWGKLAVTVNGTAAPASQLTFFPGVYQLATGTSLLAFAKDAFTVNEPGDYVSGLSSSAPALTDVGKKTMVTKAQAWLTQCLAVQETNPKDCGMNTPLPNGAALAPGSMKRTVDAGTTPFSDATPRVTYNDPNKVTMTSYVSVKVSATDTAGKTYSGSTSVTSAVGVIDGENLTVVFTN
jgi:hypothetical protein